MKQYQPNGPDVLISDVKFPDDTARRICKIVIVKPYEAMCPAEFGLVAEDIEVEVTEVKQTCDYTDSNAYKYAQCLQVAWQTRVGFINLEYDVVPWPGALEQMWGCPQPWCRFRYPVFPYPRLSDGIGCMKFGSEVLRDVSPDDWCDLAWWDLDGQVVSSIKGEGFELHEHYPPVAHVRSRPFTTSVNQSTKE